jgi:tetratricopeptide (TPR) repeat protein
MIVYFTQGVCGTISDMLLSLDTRVGIAGLIMAFAGPGIAYLLPPTKRWIGWACVGAAACLGLFWFYLEQGPPLFSFLCDFYIEKSLSAWQNGNYGNSLRYANSAIAVKPDNAIAWNNRAAAYNSMGNWEEGMTAARHALRIAPQFQLAANNLREAATHDQFFGLIPNNKNTNPNVPFEKDFE